ncbi:jouberin-like isoform X2 [Lineus longissimus]|uniref:jouberin-like isoform X2 n=1 Tax=Lineus longissimus TaxID=88925 RepID=UPI00315D00F1
MLQENEDGKLGVKENGVPYVLLSRDTSHPCPTTVQTERKKKKKRTRSKSRDKENEDATLIGSEDENQNTAAKIDELLKQALEESNADTTKKKKKKKRPVSEDPMIEKIKRGIKKDDDAALIANTYDPEDSPKNTKNKRKQKPKQTEGVENPAFDEEKDVDTPVKKGKKKKQKQTEEIEMEDKPMSISELVPPATETKKKRKKSPRPKSSEPEPEPEQPDEEQPQPAERVKKKKKKKPVVKSEDEAVEEPPQPETEEPGVDVPKKKPRKKKKARMADTQEDETAGTEEELEPLNTGDDIEEDEGEAVDEGRVLGIQLHRTDRLKSDLSISHPLVKITVVDEDTGLLLSKQSRERRVTSFFESDNSLITPIMSQPYDFKEKRSTIPVWEELIVFNENFNYFIQEKPSVTVFFEVVDFLSMNAAKERYGRSGNDGGWYRVAWAFLKLRGKNGRLNTDRKLRLQLFECPSRFRPQKDKPDVYTWWEFYPRDHYPSTLYITVKGIVPMSSEEMVPGTRSMFATQPEIGTVSYKELRKSISFRTKKMREEEDASRGPSQWGRLPGQMCKIPNMLSLTLPAGKRGCFVVKFSHDGLSLACGCQDKQDYPIIIYDIPSGKLRGKLTGHYGIIYDLCWSRRDKFLLSVSGDGTSRVWNVKNFDEPSEKLMPHPAFVYTGQFHSRVRTVVVTAGYDCVIRVWDIKPEGPHAKLLQELDLHRHFINSICFDEDGSKMYSGDANGIINVWNVFVTEQPSKRGFLRDWTLYKELVEDECKGSPINHLKVFHGDRRLLIHSRDNTIRIMDLRVFSIMQRYMGALNFREHLRSSVTPCGSFIFAGSEDSTAYVWNSETGDQVAMYSELSYSHAVSGVDFHPHDNIVAFCSYGEQQPVLVYTFDPKTARLDAGWEKQETQKMGETGLQSMKREDTKGSAWGSDFKVSSKADLDLIKTERFKRAAGKLSTVLKATNAFKDAGSGAEHEPDYGQTLGTWGSSTFDYTYSYGPSMRSGSPLPTTFSPHASRDMESSIQQQMYMSQSSYMKGGMRPTANAMGRSGSQTPAYMGRPPQMSMTQSGGRAEFSFKSSRKKMEEEEKKILFNNSPMKQVVALYDYNAARSDELCLRRGDVVTVLYKDNDNWWMGELLDGQQGFFPANYVADEGASDGDMAGFSSGDELDEAKDTKTTAVVTRGGDLKFISGPDTLEAKRNRHTRGRLDSVDSTITSTRGRPPSKDRDPMGSGGGSRRPSKDRNGSTLGVDPMGSGRGSRRPSKDRDTGSTGAGSRRPSKDRDAGSTGAGSRRPSQDPMGSTTDSRRGSRDELLGPKARARRRSKDRSGDLEMQTMGSTAGSRRGSTENLLDTKGEGLSTIARKIVRNREKAAESQA